MKKLIYFVTALLMINAACSQKPATNQEKEKVKPDSTAVRSAVISMESFMNGMGKFSLKDYEGAIAEYTKAIEMRPEYTSRELFRLRGEAKHALKDYAGAIADFTKALENSYRDGAIYYNMGLSRYESQDYNGAINDFTEAVKFDPNNMGNYYYRGLAKIESGDKSKGCLDLKKAADFNNPDAKEAVKKYCQ